MSGRGASPVGGGSPPARRGAGAVDEPALTDFRAFLFLIWRRLGLPPPTPAQYDIARYLQVGPRRKMVMAFRGVGKTGIYAAYALWRLYTAPETKILVVSASKGMADGLASVTRRLIRETPFLQPLAPRRGQRDGASCFDVGPATPSKDPSLKSIGVTGQITGSRADEILADDVETADNALTEAARAKLLGQVREFEAVLRPGGAITYLGTPQTHRSLYLGLPARGYDVRVWPAEIPADPSVYDGRLAPFVLRLIASGAAAGTPIDPARFSEADLAERRLSYGASGYALQFLLDARLTDARRHPLKLGDLMVLALAPDGAPNRLVWSDAAETARPDLPALGLADDLWRTPAEASADVSDFASAVMAIDPSGRGADETAFAVVKELNARLFLTAAGAVAGGYGDDALAALARTAGEQGVGRVIVESNFGDGMFARLLAPALAKCARRAALEEVRQAGRKEQRMLAVLEPMFAQHRLVVDEAVIRADAQAAEADRERSLFFQVTRLGPGRGALRHDDRVDALAMAVAAFAPAMGRDVDQATEAQRARALRAEVKEMMARKPRGLKPRRKPRWT